MEHTTNIIHPIGVIDVSAIPTANNIVFKNNAIANVSFLFIVLQLDMLTNLLKQLIKLL